MRYLAGSSACALAAAVLLSSLGCGKHAPGDAALGDDASAGDDSATDDGPGSADAPDDTAGGGDDGGLLGDGSTTSNCVDAAALLYVVSEERTLYSYDPKNNVFTPVGPVDCANGVAANSMAVDRLARAWINYNDGSLWQVDTKTAKCTPTNFKTNQQGVGTFGMGFAARTAGSNDERLYIDDLGGGGLGYIDLSTMALQRFGPFAGTLANRYAELTGTGDARLFGFFAGSPLGDVGSASVVQIDPVSEGAIQTWMLPTIDTGTDWAVSFWGGDFYLYTADKYNMNLPDSTLTRFRPSDGSLTVLDMDIGFRAVGASSSTCAPTVAQ